MSFASAVALIESIADSRVLFVGDAIVDEYQYVEPLGKSPKEHLIAVRHVDREAFRGGVDAAARHLETFCATVGVCTSPVAVTKARMVDRLYLRKLFEVHYGECDAIRLSPEAWACDVIVVTDFGHGAITAQTVAQLPTVPFLAVNAQTNSSNVGFNLITKYPRADYAVVDEPEARLAAGDRTSAIEDIILKIACGRFGKMVVTRGSRGAVGWDGTRFHRAPALTETIVDTMGAGDAFFAVTAPMAKAGRMEDLIRIGNAAGALKTQIVGHRQAVTKKGLLEYMSATWSDA